jgi:hypothetical protein
MLTIFLVSIVDGDMVPGFDDLVDAIEIGDLGQPRTGIFGQRMQLPAIDDDSKGLPWISGYWRSLSIGIPEGQAAQ